MKAAITVLDHSQGITLDTSNLPFNNYQAFKSNYVGLKILADTVRELELTYIANDPYAQYVAMHLNNNIPDIIPCAFNWFSVTLVNYLRLVALVDLMNTKGWKSDMLTDSSNQKIIRTHCKDYVHRAIPEIYLWRNKVAAHFAATDPFHNDNLGTLEQSIMNPVTYKYPYYHVGLVKWNTQGEISELPVWALTNAYENLSSRFWPEMQLRPIPESRKKDV